MDINVIIDFISKYSNKMEKWNAGGICFASIVSISEYISLIPSKLTPYCLLYIFVSSLFFTISKRRNTTKKPKAVCPYCGGTYEVSKYKCSNCGKEI